MTQRLVAPLLDFGGTPSMCVVVSNGEKPMDTTASSFTARNNAKRAAEKMIANGKAPAVNYGIRPRDDGRFEIVWKTAPTTGEVEAQIATAATAAEDGHYNTNPRFSVTRIRAMRHPTPGLRRPLLPLAMSPQLRARRRPARPSRTTNGPTAPA